MIRISQKAINQKIDFVLENDSSLKLKLYLMKNLKKISSIFIINLN